MLIQSARTPNHVVNLNNVFSFDIENDYDGDYNVVANSPGSYSETEDLAKAWLFTGTQDECEAYLQQLLEQLKATGVIVLPPANA